MKTAQDPRHRKRIDLVQKLFAYGYQPDQKKAKIQPILDKLSEIDKHIQQAAPEWPLSKINKVDLAILRLAVFELWYDEEVPAKVAIDEAVEIAKTYGADNSPSFVNGVLGTIVKGKENA